MSVNVQLSTQLCDKGELRHISPTTAPSNIRCLTATAQDYALPSRFVEYSSHEAAQPAYQTNEPISHEV